MYRLGFGKSSRLNPACFGPNLTTPPACMLFMVVYVHVITVELKVENMYCLSLYRKSLYTHSKDISFLKIYSPIAENLRFCFSFGVLKINLL